MVKWSEGKFILSRRGVAVAIVDEVSTEVVIVVTEIPIPVTRIPKIHEAEANDAIEEEDVIIVRTVMTIVTSM